VVAEIDQARSETAYRRTRILRHVFRYGLSVGPVLDKLFFDGKESNRGYHMRNFVKDEYLVQYDLGKNASELGCYWRLGPKGRRELSAGRGEQWRKKDHTDPLGPESIANRYAVLNFCCMRGQRVVSPTKWELEEAFPELVEGLPGRHERYYFHVGSNLEAKQLGILERDRLNGLDALFSK